MAKTTIEMTADRDRVRPGETVTVRVTVGEVDARVRSAEARLRYENTFEYETTDSDGDRTTRTQTKEVVLDARPLSAGAPAAGTYEIVLTVPPDAPPSARETVVYSVAAELDRKMARDTRAELELTVLSGEGQYADRLERPATSPPAARIDIQTEHREVRAGDPVTFVARVTGVEDLEARSLKASIFGFREDRDGCVTLYEGEDLILAEPFVLQPGVTSEHRGTVTVPADGPPTFTAAHNELRWYLDVRLDRRLKKDPAGRLELVVRT